MLDLAAQPIKSSHLLDVDIHYSILRQLLSHRMKLKTGNINKLIFYTQSKNLQFTNIPYTFTRTIPLGA